MKLSWVTITEQGRTPDDTLRVSVNIRRWHPGFWLFVIKTLWRSGG